MAITPIGHLELQRIYSEQPLLQDITPAFPPDGYQVWRGISESLINQIIDLTAEHDIQSRYPDDAAYFKSHRSFWRRLVQTTAELELYSLTHRPAGKKHTDSPTLAGIKLISIEQIDGTEKNVAKMNAAKTRMYKEHRKKKGLAKFFSRASKNDYRAHHLGQVQEPRGLVLGDELYEM